MHSKRLSQRRQLPASHEGGQGCRRARRCRTHVVSPSRPEVAVVASGAHTVQDKNVSIDDVRAPVASDMNTLVDNLLNVVGNRHPMLMAAAQQIFGAGGKKIRPMLIFLVARATMKSMQASGLTERHRRLAEITEMLHTASLVHDDVLDECDTRRGKQTVNSLYGTRVAVLAGDFLFAESSAGLARLDSLEVIKLISQVIADFANGEISQATALFDTSLTTQQYLDKSFFKTASLIAASCRSAAVFSGCSEDMKAAMFGYGKHLGLAFQIVDDVLDFTSTAEQLGKPRYQDIESGNLTAPVLIAMKKCPELRDLIESEFLEEGSVRRAVELIEQHNGFEEAKDWARSEGQEALRMLTPLPACAERESLETMVEYVLKRIN